MRPVPPLLLALLLSLLPACRPPAGPGREPAPGVSAAGPVIRVTASYPGASAQVVDETVLAPLFQQINGVEGATRIESEAWTDGTGTLTVQFGPEVDLDKVQVLVQNRVALAQPTLPALVVREGVTVRKTPAGPPAFWLALTNSGREYDGLYLANFARLQLKDVIARVSGVADVRVIGDGEYAVRVWLDPDKLAVNKLTVEDVVKAVWPLKLRSPAGQAEPPKGQPLRFDLIVPGRQAKPDQLLKLILKADPEGNLVRLRDVARVELGSILVTEWAQVNGKPAAVLAVAGWPGKVTAGDLRKTIPTDTFPKGLRAEVVADLTTDRLAWVDIQLPDAASRERTERVAERAVELIRGLPGKPDCVAFGDERSENRATIIVKLPENGPTLADIRKPLAQIQEAVCRVSEVAAGREPFPVRIAITDPGAHGEKDFQVAADAVLRRVSSEGAAIDAAVFPRGNIPMLYLDIDRTKLKELGVSLDDVMSTLQVYTGVKAGGVNDFNKFGRTWSVQIAGAVRARPDELGKLQVRNAQGQMVRLGTVLSVRDVEGAEAVIHIDGHRALLLTANPPAGKSAAEAAAACLKIAAAELPKGYKAVDLTADKPR